MYRFMLLKFDKFEFLKKDMFIPLGIFSCLLLKMLTHIANSFFGVMDDLYRKDPDINSQDDRFVYMLMKENRYLYLSLLLIFIVLVANLIYKPKRF